MCIHLYGWESVLEHSEVPLCKWVVYPVAHGGVQFLSSCFNTLPCIPLPCPLEGHLTLWGEMLRTLGDCDSKAEREKDLFCLSELPMQPLGSCPWIVSGLLYFHCRFMSAVSCCEHCNEKKWTITILIKSLFYSRTPLGRRPNLTPATPTSKRALSSSQMGWGFFC